MGKLGHSEADPNRLNDSLCWRVVAVLLVFSSVGIGFCQQDTKPSFHLNLATARPIAISDDTTNLFPNFITSVRCQSAANAEAKARAIPLFIPLGSSSIRNFVSSCDSGSLFESVADDGPESAGKLSSSRTSIESSLIELSSSEPEHQSDKVQWKSLIESSSMYLGTMHGFRLATEQGTRSALHNSVFGGYFRALGSMHGWSDGDGYFENYLGHPIEGAVASYIWIHNDPKYRTVEFGKRRDYWMSRLRAYAYAWAFSEQFEIGLTSEASVGQIQRYCCAYGFVDHVVTPNFGMIWVVGGDILDRYVVRRTEDRTSNVAIRAIVRAALNPPLTFANIMTLQVPWHRENRPGVRSYSGDLYTHQPTHAEAEPSALPHTPKFELTAAIPTLTRYGNLSCLGGRGIVGFRISDSWQWSGEVGGCTLGNDRPSGWSGDSLTFLMGPQWVSHTESPWSPYFHVRFGGQKITQDYCLKYEKSKVLTEEKLCKTDPTGYVKHYESTGVAFSTGTGVDLRINRILEARLVSFDYIHSWLARVGGTDFNQGFRFSAGLGLKVGTW